MRVAVTQRESVGPYGGFVDSLEREYISLLEDMGLDAFPISAFTRDVARFLDAVRPDLVLLTGGGVIQADAYRRDVSVPRQPERDRVEDVLVEEALQRRVPIAGICRGMHKLNAFFGGCVSPFNGLPAPREVGDEHPVKLSSGERFMVNSFHAVGVFPADLGEGLEAIAFDPDNGTVEAIRHIDHRAFAVQWHPERMDAGECARIWFEQEVCRMLDVCGSGAF